MRIVTDVKSFETKSAAPAGGLDFLSFYEFLSKGSWNDLAAHQAISYYKQVAPLFHGIDLISDEVASIRPQLYDKQKEELIDSHPLLTLLSRPNATTTGEDFIKQLASYFLITGNMLYVATGGLSRAPLELWSVTPTRVTGTLDPRDGYVDEYVVNTALTNETFAREEFNRTFHYVNRTKDRELFHVKNFSADDSSAFGMSKLTPIFYEIEQYLQGNVHNLSLLKNGATLSGVLSTEKNLSDDQYSRLEKELARFFQGARNAGRPMIAEGGLTYNNMASNNKDMDFRNLKKDVVDMIYLILRIPLPYISREQMTMSNFDSAKYPFYDNAVFPVWKFLMSNISDHLFSRFKLDPDKYELRFDEDEIPALAERHLSETERVGKTGALTTNEIRNRMGYGEIEGGDTLYQPMTLVPLGMDRDTSDQSPNDRKKQLEFYRDFLTKKGYSAEEIEAMVKRNFGVR